MFTFIFHLLLLVLIFIIININCYKINSYDNNKRKDKYKHDDIFLSSSTLITNNNSMIISLDEWNALYDFYNSTNGNYWIWQNESISGLKWNFTNGITNSNVCLWQGLSCTCSNSTEYHQYRYDELIDGPYGGYYANYYDDGYNNYYYFNYTNCNIDKIYLINYNLTGILLPSISNLTNLSHIHLIDNHLYNDIPSTISKLTNLEILSLGINSFRGNNILNYISNITTLRYLSLDNNQFSGSIPNSISMLTNLESMSLDSNRFVGSLPSSVGMLVKLYNLGLADNQFTRYIPNSISKLANLEILNLYRNQFSGTIPTSLSLLTKLEVIDFSINRFQGVILSNLVNMTNLFFISIHENNFISSIPYSIGNFNNLGYLWTFNNSFTNSIPSSINKLTSLYSLRLGNNNFNNTIPNLSNLINLEILELYSNKLSSSIPSSIQYLINLQQIKLNNNLLNGKLDNVFNSTIQKFISSIDVSENSLTGTLSKDIFNIKTLESFIAYSNCIEGSIPINVCSLFNLNALILDGLSSSTSCKNYIFPRKYIKSLPTSFQLNNSIGHINECLFNMSNLQTLHLSGIGLEGSLPSSIVISSSLKELSLSHNLFSNVVPEVIQNNNWTNLELSYNNFNGILNIKQINYPVKLDNNLLSGELPQSLINTNKSISILNGNIFSCSILNPKLPQNDTDIGDYSCGSNNFNISIALFTIIIVFVYLLKSKIWLFIFENICDFMILCIYLRPYYDTNLNILKNVGIENTKKKLNSELNFELANKVNIVNELDNIRLSDNYSVNLYNNITLLCELSDKLRKVLLILIYYIILFWLPISILLNYYYGVYQVSYAYTISSTFLSGVVPSIIIFLLVIFTSIGIYYIKKNVLFDNVHNNKDMRIENIIKKKELKIKLSLFLVFLVDINSMFFINGLFIYATFNFNTIDLFLIEIIVSFFKVIWKLNILPFIIKKTKALILKDENISSDAEVLFQSCLSVINNIIIPLLSVTILSPKCFYYVFVPPEKIISSYSYQQCDGLNSINNECNRYETIIDQTIYNAPFVYSYQCSSSIATTYSSIYINMAVFLATTGPLSIKLVDYLYSKIDHDSAIFKIIDKIIPDVLKPINFIKDNNIVNVKYFNQSNFIVNIVNYISITVTIGFIIPIVGIVCSICLSIYIHNTLSSLGERISKFNEEEEENKEKLINNYEKSIGDIYTSLDHCLKIILLPLICVFYSFFIFDIFGNVVGSNIAKYSIYTTIIIIPLIVVIYEKIIEYRKKNANIMNSSKIDNIIELNDKIVNELQNKYFLDIKTIRIE
jgi:Leucine-rich repeat (LRR) protein